MNWLDLPLLLFLLSAVVGVWPAYDRSQSQGALLALAAGYLLYLLISRSATRPRVWRITAGLMVLVCGALALFFATHYGHLGYPQKIHALERLGALFSSIVPQLFSWVPVDNSVATFLMGGFFLSISLLLTERNKGWRIAEGLGLGVIALALLMSTATGAWLGIMAGVVLWFAWYWRPARLAALGGLLLALGIVIYVVLRGEITALGEIPIINRTIAPFLIRPDRLEVYRNSVYLLQDFPLTGIGLGPQFGMVYSRYALLIRHVLYEYSHNLYLEVWLQQGLMGILAWLCLMAVFFQAVRAHAVPGTDLLYQSVWIGFMALLVQGLTDARSYVDGWCWFPFFGLLGLLGAMLHQRKEAVSVKRPWIVPAVVCSFFVLVVGISILPWRATWYANQGSLLQARGELANLLENRQRDELIREAVDCYQRAIELDPANRTAQQRLGVYLTAERRFDQAVQHLELAWQADTDNSTSQKGLGLAYVWVGELDKAQVLLEEVPNIVQELNVWGGYWEQQRLIRQSINAFRMSLRLRPGQPGLAEKLAALEAEVVP